MKENSSRNQLNHPNSENSAKNDNADQNPKSGNLSIRRIENSQNETSNKIDQVDNLKENDNQSSHHKEILKSNESANNINSNQANVSSHKSNRNILNEETIVQNNSVRSDSNTLKQYFKKNTVKTKKDINQRNLEQMEQDIKNGSKQYELIGYTTVGKINHNFEKENRQKFIKNTLITILLIIIILLTILIMNPFKDGIDFNKILGLDSKYQNLSEIESESIQNTETVDIIN